MISIPHNFILTLQANIDWESILPILIFVVYGIVQFLGSKNKGKEEELSEEEISEREAAEERARKIREEIRRKIQDRMNGTQEVSETAREENRPTYDPTVPERTPTSAKPETQTPAQSSRPEFFPKQSTPQPEVEENSIQAQLAEQAKLLRETRRKRDDAQRRAAAITKKAGLKSSSWNKPSRTSSDLFRDDHEFIRSIRNPSGARKALIASEILGKPKALKEETSMV